MKKQLLTTALAGLMTLSFNVAADETAFNDAEKAVEYRQKALSVMKENFSAMAAMVKGEVEYNADFFNVVQMISRKCQVFRGPVLPLKAQCQAITLMH